MNNIIDLAEFPGYLIGADGYVYSRWRSGKQDLFTPRKRKPVGYKTWGMKLIASLARRWFNAPNCDARSAIYKIQAGETWAHLLC